MGCCKWCAGQDLNLHSLRNQPLKLACLPISPPAPKLSLGLTAVRTILSTAFRLPFATFGFRGFKFASFLFQSNFNVFVLLFQLFNLIDHRHNLRVLKINRFPCARFDRKPASKSGTSFGDLMLQGCPSNQEFGDAGRLARFLAMIFAYFFTASKVSLIIFQTLRRTPSCPWKLPLSLGWKKCLNAEKPRRAVCLSYLKDINMELNLNFRRPISTTSRAGAWPLQTSGIRPRADPRQSGG